MNRQKKSHVEKPMKKVLLLASAVCSDLPMDEPEVSAREKL
jgi:hypothetical protein